MHTMPSARPDPKHIGYLRASMPQLRAAFSNRVVDASCNPDAGCDVCLWRVQASSAKHKNTLVSQLLAKGFVIESC